jgi:hypothetical protein
VPPNAGKTMQICERTGIVAYRTSESLLGLIEKNEEAQR